ncbi:MAG: Tfp pilus biogenesis protein PilC [Candidatus Daviesbacteria bacterium GW2011_GWA1_41_61]|uniref:Tfp pilus biogenesis protein PilC n=1 Tax=Candidatus Daviesbacteria bacterium GW2011_GWA2_40_9 TaxID=1618424 RepID=A0A0G0U995_9BACT|nr:MAG: Tfp pilus biogenesis protein PilC, type IV pilus assembly protein PilC [Candidatus Daviesbacteria bacterium GW2011_GWC1_40_9]KKR83856.1 MAG: Tfp pilus biogenesis protein PilC [Candidatus Daviesbacteria bacterium GW2011_GWA2_40_9]KKR93465.1 MAG: Tfp pilus biogenesis protein PilC [Candidatus Daviesbacteria bacterium GW2011_GWB1_41_15]KKS14986.1 MAG: Tfp pilus biogenesis protein PilC [Candidatus Daviesbacteria bacterium GW2011_GWA1_41_61]
MAVFTYAAKDNLGQYHKGEVEAANEYQAANLVRRQKLIIISLKSKTEISKGFFLNFFNRVPFSEIVVTTRQLATMVAAGLVLSEALDILKEQQTNARLKKVLEYISTDVKGGLDFASSIEKFPDVFPNLYAKLVRAGQASGKLDIVLQDLATTLEKEREFKSKVKGAMIYPLVVVIMMFVVIGVMVFFVMPRLMGLYKESGIELPLPTKIVIAFTGFISGFWWAILLALVLVFLVTKKYTATAEGRYHFDRFILETPVLGKISRLIVLTNFTRTFSLLTASGLSILDAIKIVSDVVGNKVYQEALSVSYRGVERGLPLSGQLLGLPIFPRIVGQMVKTGEETGKLDEVMSKLAQYFESESEHSLKNITTLIEPIVLIVLGVGVGFLVISVIMPIYQLTTNIK